MANEARGEFEVTLEGVTYGMRPSFEAIDAFERATGKGLLVLAAGAADQTLTTAETAAIVTECVKAWGRSLAATEPPELRAATGFNAPRVRELLADSGFLVVMMRLKLMLWLAATGGLTSAGEMKAMPTTTETETPAPVSAASPAQP